MADNNKRNHQMSAYETQCGDGSSGRISAESPEAAAEMAEEMCQVHDGVSKRPSPRTGG